MSKEVYKLKFANTEEDLKIILPLSYKRDKNGFILSLVINGLLLSCILFGLSFFLGNQVITFTLLGVIIFLILVSLMKAPMMKFHFGTNSIAKDQIQSSPDLLKEKVFTFDEVGIKVEMPENGNVWNKKWNEIAEIMKYKERFFLFHKGYLIRMIVPYTAFKNDNEIESFYSFCSSRIKSANEKV